MRQKRITILLVALVVGASATPALAHDHRSPRVVLRSHGEKQRAQVWSSDWTTRQGKFCSTGIGDGIPNYRRRAMVWNPNNPLHLYLYKRQKPKNVKVRIHRRLGNDGFPEGRGRRVQVHVRRKILDNGRRVRIADFKLSDRRRFYVDARAVWRDIEGCGGSQSLDMVFHIRRK